MKVAGKHGRLIFLLIIMAGMLLAYAYYSGVFSGSGIRACGVVIAHPEFDE